MVTINVSLPDSLKQFVDEQVSARGFGTASEYVRELIRHDRDRSLLRERIRASAEAEFSETREGAYFERLRDVIRNTGDTAAAR